ncbi:MAG: GNAT family N-acetyltransferase [Anaerolineales bacterium]|nr:GNAT family N-acetyltransferase [Anaerolineales bacterium]
MNISFDDLAFRPATFDDAQRVLELMERCEVAEYGEPDSSLEDILHDWEQMDLARDSWLAFTPQGDLVGYAAVMPWTERLRYDFFIDPVLGSDELGGALLERCQGRGRALARERSEQNWRKVVVYIAQVNQGNRRLLESAAFQAARHHFQMQIELDAPPAAPRWPDGIDLRAVQPDQDARSLHALIETAFARPGRTATSFEEWSKLMLRSDIFDPTLWFLALDGQEIVGACLGFEYPGSGWVRQLAVTERWRGRGLGSALLLHAFGEFRQRGFTKAGLGVAADNPNAYSLYEKVGMRRVREYAEYEKAIDE